MADATGITVAVRRRTLAWKAPLAGWLGGFFVLAWLVIAVIGPWVAP